MPRKKKYAPWWDGYTPIKPETLKFKVYEYGTSNLLGEYDTFEETKAAIDALGTLRTRLVIPYGITEIPDYAFNGCYYLSAVDFPSSLITIGGSSFDYCSIKEVIIPDSVETIGEWAFSGSRAYEIEGQTSVVIGNSVKTIEKLAFNAAYIDVLVLGSSVETIGEGAFSSNNITSLVLPSSLKTISKGAFEQCLELEGTITIPDSVETIGENAFGGCPKLQEIIINKQYNAITGSPWSNWATYAAIRWIPVVNFQVHDYETKELLGIYDTINEAKAAINGNARGVTLVCPYGTTEIATGFFARSSMLYSIELPSSMTTLNTAAFNAAGLRELRIPHNITSIGQYMCTNCTSLTKLFIGDGVKTISQESFKECTALTEVWNTGGPEIIEKSAFQGDSSLSRYELWGLPSLREIGDAAFHMCSLEAFNLGHTKTIGQAAFYRNQLKSVSDRLAETVGTQCFAGNPNIYSVDLYSVKTLGQRAFSCLDSSPNTKLTNIEFGRSLESIGEDAFYNCTALETISINKTTDSVSGSPWGATNATVVWSDT